MGELLDNLKEFLESEAGKKSIQEYAETLVKKQELLDSQLERFHNRNLSDKEFSDLVEKISNKYDSESYKKRWWTRSSESPEDLLWFLFDYAKKYGTECIRSEWKLYANDFTTELYFAKGFYFNLMVGQGCAIKVIKQNEN